MAILRFKDGDGNIHEVLSLKGEKGAKGEKGDTGVGLPNYGIGGVAWLQEDADIDAITKTGVYSYATANTSPNKPTPVGDIIHIERGGATNTALQIAVDANYPYPRLLMRKRGASGWGNWCNDVMPCNPGAEYLTTERYKGVPVYCKILTYTPTATLDGSGGITVKIPHKITGFGELVRCEATISGDAELKQYFHLPYANQNGGTTSVMLVDNTDITVGVYKMMWLVNNTFSVKLYYTKE